MDYGYDNNIGGFFYTEAGLMMGSLPAVNPLSAAGLVLGDGGLADGFTWTEYRAERELFQNKADGRARRPSRKKPRLALAPGTSRPRTTTTA